MKLAAWIMNKMVDDYGQVTVRWPWISGRMFDAGVLKVLITSKPQFWQYRWQQRLFPLVLTCQRLLGQGTAIVPEVRTTF